MVAPLIAAVPLIAEFLPTLGRWISGDKGEQVADQIVGLARSVTGAETAEQAILRLRENRELVVQLQTQAKELEIAWLNAEVQQMQAVNETMRAEAASEHWVQYTWRPFIGFCAGLAFLVLCVFVCLLAWQAIMNGKAEAMAMIPNLVATFATLFAFPATVLGIASYHRGHEKRARAEATGADLKLLIEGLARRGTG